MKAVFRITNSFLLINVIINLDSGWLINLKFIDPYAETKLIIPLHRSSYKYRYTVRYVKVSSESSNLVTRIHYEIMGFFIIVIQENTGYFNQTTPDKWISLSYTAGYPNVCFRLIWCLLYLGGCNIGGKYVIIQESLKTNYFSKDEFRSFLYNDQPPKI